MQENTNKNLHLSMVLGKYIKKLRIAKGYISRNKFANEYGLDDGNLCRIEQGKCEAKFVTVYKIAQALGMKYSDFLSDLEKELGSDFTLIDL